MFHAFGSDIAMDVGLKWQHIELGRSLNLCGGETPGLPNHLLLLPVADFARR
jgi:hypothetical protein